MLPQERHKSGLMSRGRAVFFERILEFFFMDYGFCEEFINLKGVRKSLYFFRLLGGSR
jgi:hypothetical protein